MEMEGVYRVSGSHKTVNELQLLYDRNQDPDLNKYEPFVITGVCKKYLTLLPVPVMTFELYENFLGATKVRNKNERIRAIKQLVHELPQANQSVLKQIIQHLIKISQKSETNKMTIPNLAIVFGPTLFRLPSENPIRALTDAPLLSGCVQVLIREFDKVFGDSPIEDEIEDAGQNESMFSSWEKMRSSRKSRRGNRDTLTKDRTMPPTSHDSGNEMKPTTEQPRAQQENVSQDKNDANDDEFKEQGEENEVSSNRNIMIHDVQQMSTEQIALEMMKHSAGSDLEKIRSITILDNWLPQRSHFLPSTDRKSVV